MFCHKSGGHEQIMKLDDVFGIHEQALKLRAKRGEILAANLANADTPNYKARDIDFQQVLKGQTQGDSQVRLAATQPGHIAPSLDPTAAAHMMYRVPAQPSLDGNTVEAEREQMAFSSNSFQYQASLRFLDGRIKGLLTAIRGN